MAKLNKKKFKQLLNKSLKILPPGERHKDWSSPVFENLPKEWIFEGKDSEIVFVWAGDIEKKQLEYYTVRKIREDKKIVEGVAIAEKHKVVACYFDAVAIVPKEIL